MLRGSGNVAGRSGPDEQLSQIVSKVEDLESQAKCFSQVEKVATADD
jgi:hypothetical protein